MAAGAAVRNGREGGAHGRALASRDHPGRRDKGPDPGPGRRGDPVDGNRGGPAGEGQPGGTIGAGSGTGGNGAAASSAADAVTPDTDLATIAELVGHRVRVGGLIARVAEAGFDLDDGTALARVELRGGMADLVPLLRQGEAIAAKGTVELVDEAPVVVVDETGTLVRVGTLGQAVPIAPAAGSEPTASAGNGAGALAADTSGGFGGGPAGDAADRHV